MLPSSRRIPRSLYADTLKNARTFHSEHFSMRVGVLPSSDSPTRMGVVVASSVVKMAHDRNTLKRRVRAVIEKELPGIQNGFVVAFFAKKGAGARTFSEVSQEVSSLLRKSGLVVL